MTTSIARKDSHDAMGDLVGPARHPITPLRTSIARKASHEAMADLAGPATHHMPLWPL
ncbi:MAG: hypothetical protein LBT40_08395 [Deltaproteobacteria bacterium]|nr:hypothetical protein [Deltaproteobacteria bacterium]